MHPRKIYHKARLYQFVPGCKEDSVCCALTTVRRKNQLDPVTGDRIAQILLIVLLEKCMQIDEPADELLKWIDELECRPENKTLRLNSYPRLSVVIRDFPAELVLRPDEIIERIETEETLVCVIRVVIRIRKMWHKNVRGPVCLQDSDHFGH